MRVLKTPAPRATSVVRRISVNSATLFNEAVGDPHTLYFDTLTQDYITTSLYSSTEHRFNLYDDGLNNENSRVLYYVYKRDFPTTGSVDKFYVQTSGSGLQCYVWSENNSSYLLLSAEEKINELYTTDPIKIMNNRCVLPSTPIGQMVWNTALIFEDLENSDFLPNGKLKNDRDYCVAECIGFTIQNKAVTFNESDRSFLNNKHAVFTYLSHQ